MSNFERFLFSTIKIKKFEHMMSMLITLSYANRDMLILATCYYLKLYKRLTSLLFIYFILKYINKIINIINFDLENVISYGTLYSL